MEDKKVKVVIEESVSQAFWVDEKDLDKVPEMYKKGQLIVDNGEMQDVHYMVEYDDGATTNWMDI